MEKTHRLTVSFEDGDVDAEDVSSIGLGGVEVSFGILRLLMDSDGSKILLMRRDGQILHVRRFDRSRYKIVGPTALRSAACEPPEPRA